MGRGGCGGGGGGKRVVWRMRTAKAQIRLRIRAVWSGPSHSANVIIGYYRMYGEQKTGWNFSHAHFTHVQMPFFASRSPYDLIKRRQMNEQITYSYSSAKRICFLFTDHEFSHFIVLTIKPCKLV